MADKLTVKIDVVPTGDPNVPQTVSKFVVLENAQVTFINAATAQARVEFEGNGPLCMGSQKQNPVVIDPGQEQKLKVCVADGQFKYQATVDGALTEDPILIVERLSLQPGTEKKPIFIVEGIPMLVIGGLLGILVGYLISKRLLTRSR
jgi:hypothetical protein